MTVIGRVSADERLTLSADKSEFLGRMDLSEIDRAQTGEMVIG